MNLFSERDSSHEVDSVILSTDESDGHSYARCVCVYVCVCAVCEEYKYLFLHYRGATIEKCVEFLTESISHLWGGFSLKSGPRNHGNDLGHRATKQQITTFFLTCYQTYMHPVILTRLLLHRLATPCSQNPFDWSLNPDKRSLSCSHADSMPAHQATTLKVVVRWLEDHPDDFISHPLLSVSVD